MEKLGKMRELRRVVGAYFIRHVSSGKVYIGSSGNLAYRLGQHLRSLRLGRHHSRVLQELFDLNPETEIVYFREMDREAAYAKEQELLDEGFRTTPSLILNTARHVTKPQLGIPISEKQKQAIRQAQLGRRASDEARRKMSLAQRGRKHSPESIEKVRQVHLGRKRSEQTKEAMRANRKDVRAVEVDGVVYRSSMEAARQLGINQATVWFRANNPRCLNWNFVRISDFY